MSVRTISNAGGNWSATTTWVEGIVPVAGDDIVATATSGASTIDADISTGTVDFTNYVATLTHAAAVTLTITGLKLTFVAGMTYTLGSTTTSAITFTSTSGTTLITSAGKTFGNVTINGAGGTFQLQDTSSVSTAATVSIVRGTLVTNNQTCNWGSLRSDLNTGAWGLSLGSSNVTLAGNIAGTATSLTTGLSGTVTAGTSTITSTAPGTAFSSSYALNNVVINGSGTTILSLTSVVNLTCTGTAVKTDGLSIRNQGFTVTGTLTLTGNSITNRLLVNTYPTPGSPFTITTPNTPVLTNVDFQDITAAGAGSPWTGTSLGDALGNTSITFAAGVTRYGVVAGNWSSTATWSSSSGGAGGASVPLPQDSVILDALSAAGTYTIDMPRYGGDLTCTGFTRTLNVSIATTGFGNYTLASGMTLAGTSQTTLSGRGTQTITGAGQTILWTIAVTCPGGSYTLQDDLIINATHGLAPIYGTVNFNGHSPSFGNVQSNFSSTRSIILGSGTTTLTGTGTVWNLTATGMTLTQNTSTIVVSDVSATSKTFSSAGLVYNNLTITGGGTGSVSFPGSSTYNVLTFNGPKTILLTAGTTQTVTTLNSTGTAGNLITINSTTAGTQATIAIAPPGSASDYLSLKDIAATGAGNHFAGGHSTNTSNNTGWSFTTGTVNSDTVTTTDNVLRVIVQNRSTSESQTTSDTPTRLTTTARAVTDTTSLSDVVVNQQRYPRIASESSTTSDIPLRGTTVSRVLTDTTSTSDAFTSLHRAARTFSETLVTLDALARRATFIRIANDLLTTSDAVSRASGHPRLLNEILITADTTRRSFTDSRALVESLVTIDVMQRAEAIRRAIAESLSVSDRPIVIRAQSRSISDTLSTLDSLIRQGAFGRTDIEIIPTLDVLTRMAFVNRSTSETNTTSDAVARRAVQARVIGDALLTLDAIGRNTTVRRSMFDTNITTDLLTSIGRHPRNIYEFTTVSDSPVLIKSAVPIMGFILVTNNLDRTETASLDSYSYRIVKQPGSYDRLYMAPVGILP